MKKAIRAISVYLAFVGIFQTTAISATFTVTNNNWDNNPGSLRWAINQANINPGADDITFTGTRVITPTDVIVITSQININSTNNPNVIIQNAAFDGFMLQAGSNNTIIQNLTINNSTNNGIYIGDANDITIDNVNMINNNLFGLFANNTNRITITNSTASGGGQNGINLFGGTGHQVTNSSIYGNIGAGLSFIDVSDALVENNKVGVMPDGNTFNGTTKNQGHGVYFTTNSGSSNNNTVQNNTIANNGNSDQQHDLYFEGNGANTALMTNNVTQFNNIGFTANGTLARADGNGISYAFTSGGAITNNLISGGQYNATAGVSIYGAVNLLVEDNTIDQANSIGVFFGGGASDVVIQDNTITNTSAAGLGVGLFIDNVINALITQNTITDNNDDGIQAHNSTTVGTTQILSNTISNNGGDGIDLNGVSTLPIIDNTINNNGESGIELNDGNNLTITNNTINDNNINGITINEGTQNTITTNTIANNTGDGIALTAALANQDDLQGNSITCNSGIGVNLNAIGNNNFPTPTIDAVNTTNSRVVGTATPNSTIQIFDNTCDCEAQTLISTQAVNGTGAFDVAIPTVADSSRVTVFATDANGNTSQLTSCCRVAAPSFDPPITTLCSTTSVDLVLSLHVGGEFQLQQSPNGSSGWTNLGPTQTAADSIWTVNPSTTTYYRVVATSNGWGAPTPYQCQDISPVAQVIIAPGVQISGITPTHPSCGTNNGAINTTATGGSTPYNWSIDGSGTFPAPNNGTFNNLSSGNYQVIVYDNNSCSDTITTTLVTPNGPVLSSTKTDVLCNGGSTGSINITTTGGTAGYTYSWGNGAATEDISGLIAGTYTLTVTDANLCSDQETVTINEPNPLIATLSGSDLECNGDNTGAIDLTVSGGYGSYTFLWNTSDVSEDLSGLSAGTYNVTVTDENSCTTTSNTILNQPTPLNSTVVITNALCNGGTGSIDQTVTGGTGPYTFLWDNGASTEDLIGVPADATYSVTTTDANNCQITNVGNILQPSSLAVSINVTDVSCNGLSDGAIALNVSGGVPQYSYDWSTQSSPDLIDVNSDTYYVIITDNNGCQLDTSQYVDEPDPINPTVSIALLDPLVCEGDPATVEVSNTTFDGGSPSFNWYVNGISAGTGTSYTDVFENGDQIDATMLSSHPCATNPVTSNVVNAGTEVCSCPLWIPNAISPNGDGANEGWAIQGLECWETHDVRVYNRWGNMVYQSNDYETPWNGMRHGTPMPIAVYYYIVEVTQKNGHKEAFNGALTIMR